MENPYYSAEDVSQSYQNLGIKNGDTVYITGNFGRLGVIKDCSKSQLLSLHLEIIQELIGENGTLVVPTHTFSICSSNTPYSPKLSASETGPFSEFIRTQEQSVRQYHAFSSSCALGKNAHAICSNNSRHVYGMHSPFARMLELDAKFISVGMEARTNVSLVHHAEFMMGVPYRYVKEFFHPVEKEGVIGSDYFYLHVLYRDMPITRNRNKTFFDYFQKKYELAEQKVGLSKIQSFRMKEFIETTTEMLSDNIYAWLDEAPKHRPFQC